MSDDLLPEAVRRAHDDAVDAGEGMYKDPLSSNWVMTSATLAARGYCCGSGCRHCPYSPEQRALAGRVD